MKQKIIAKWIDKRETGLICTKTFLHEESNMHGDSTMHEDFFAGRHFWTESHFFTKVKN